MIVKEIRKHEIHTPPIQPGDFVVSLSADSGGRVVLVTEWRDGETFAGVVLVKGTGFYEQGAYKKDWVKRLYQRYNGKLELENEP